MKIVARILMALMAFILSAGIILLVSALLIGYKGKHGIETKNTIPVPQIATEDRAYDNDKSISSSLQEGMVIHNDTLYKYNDDLTTFLIMGIDRADEETESSENTLSAGQADAIFLLVLNPHDTSLKIIGINRNTMTDVDIYDQYGSYVTTERAQIAVAHGFGDGGRESCEYEKTAVSKLFYSLPIHGYVAVSMRAIPILNDAVGGVDITPDYCFSSGEYVFNEEETIHLDGKKAAAYLRYRDVDQAASADLRLQRQKGYLSLLLKKFMVQNKENPDFLAKLYRELEGMMTTDVSLEETLYLAANSFDYDLSDNNFYLLKGITNIGDEFEEFYPDEDALKDLMIDVFYEKAEAANVE